MSTKTLNNVILDTKQPDKRSSIQITESRVTSVQPDTAPSSSPPTLLLPTLCHPHIHLDKSLLLTSHAPAHLNLPDYSGLAPKSGTFAEALDLTSKAKTRYTHNDLIHRGSQVIAESIRAGVTCMRAFVEVDHATRFKCIAAGVELKQRFRGMCHVQLCVFAQDPVMNSEKHGDENRALVEEALERYDGEVEVLGSTPYVEGSAELQWKNIEWAVGLAVRKGLLLDFHLDYNLDKGLKAMVWDVLGVLRREDWMGRNAGKTVVLGHCTRLTLFEDGEMEELAGEINREDEPLPVHFVGLPTSDLFMMGRPEGGVEGARFGSQRPRGSLQVVEMIKKFGLNACMGINNVGNAFTPWGSLDPLRLASLGVGIYQAGTKDDARLLFECVSTRARQALCLRSYSGQGNDLNVFSEGSEGPFLVIENRDKIELLGRSFCVPAKQYLDEADIVWDPPDLCSRYVIGT